MLYVVNACWKRAYQEKTWYNLRFPVSEVVVNLVREDNECRASSYCASQGYPHRSVSVFSVTLPCIPQTISCEDTDVQSRSPLFSCSGRKACVAGSNVMGIPRGSHTNTHPRRLKMTARPVNLWLSPTSVNCPNPFVRSYSHSHPGHLTSLHNPRSQYQQTTRRENCTVSHVLYVSAPTLAKQADPWAATFGNTTGHWRMEI